MLCKNVKWCDVSKTLKKVVLKKVLVNFFDNMKDKNRIEILLEFTLKI